MNLYDLPQLQYLYFCRSQYSQPAPSPADQFVRWPETYQPLLREKPFLEQVLTKQVYQPGNLADQVFGRQTHQTRLGVKRLAQLLYERCLLHYRHMGEIKHRHMQMQEYLSLTRFVIGPDAGRRQSNLEKLLAQLESDKRREELDFWKDTAELRQSVFDKATEYATLKDRVDILSSLGVAYG